MALTSSKRKPYTPVESEAIWNYIVKNNLHDKVNQRSIWHDIQRALRSKHSVESLRSHYRQVLWKRDESLRNDHNRSKRRPFTPEEDEKILNYIRQHNLYDFIGLHSSWKQMQQDLGLPHSADSMRSRFRRCLTGKVSTVPSLTTPLNDVSSSPCLTDTYVPDSTTSPVCSSSPRRLCHSRPVRRTRREASQRIRNRSISPSAPPSSVTLVTDDIPISSSLTSRLGPILQARQLPVTPVRASFLVTMTNGSVQEIANFLRAGVRVTLSSTSSPPSWTPADDALLNSCDLDELQSLITRFGPAEVCSRIAYLAS